MNWSSGIDEALKDDTLFLQKESEVHTEYRRKRNSVEQTFSNWHAICLKDELMSV